MHPRIWRVPPTLCAIAPRARESYIAAVLLVVASFTTTLAFAGGGSAPRRAPSPLDFPLDSPVPSGGPVDAYGRHTFVALDDGTFGPLELAPPTGSPAAQPELAGSANHPLFRPYVSYVVPDGTHALAIGDVTGDGLLDVVAVEALNDVVYVFAQTAAGVLAAPVSYPTPIPNQAVLSGSVAIADMNGDARLDVIVSVPNAVGVMLQTPDGRLAEPRKFPTVRGSFSNVFKLRTGDFNHDGLTDVASIDWGTQSQDVDVFLQQPPALLQHSAVLKVIHGGYDDMEVGDVNGDGLDDLVVMSGQTYFMDNFGVAAQTPGAGLGTPIYYDLAGDQNTHGVGVGDVDGDGRNDVVLSSGGNRPRSTIAIFAQEPGGLLGAPTILPSYDIPGPVEVADVNLDGRADVLTVHNGWEALGVYLQDDAGALKSETLFKLPYASLYNSQGMAVGDLNGDEKPDVAIADYNHGVVVLYNDVITKTAALDVRPGSCPNPFNPRSEGVLPVALLGGADFDVSTARVASLRLEGQVPQHWSLEDVSGPAGSDPCGCAQLLPDGYPDLMMQFQTQAIAAEIGQRSPGDVVTLTLRGALTDGTPLTARDCVVLVGRPNAEPALSSPRLFAASAIRTSTPSVRFRLLARSEVELSVYDLSGRRVRCLVQSTLEAGSHSMLWNTSGLSTGIYFYRLRAGADVTTARWALVH